LWRVGRQEVRQLLNGPSEVTVHNRMPVILRGVKNIEYRSGPTNVRGRILIYASLGRYSTGDEADMMAEYGIKDVTCEEFPRGVLVGSVELFDCDGGDWHVCNPHRAEKLVTPTNQPQPVWFRPF
jgi:ASCH domain